MDFHLAAEAGDLDRVRVFVEQGADMEEAKYDGWTPLMIASWRGNVEVVRYLLEQGTNRDKENNLGFTSLHLAALHGHLEVAKLLMVYGADLNARDNDSRLPIDYADNEEVKQAIRDEPRRRMDHGHKRATEQDRHSNAAASAFAQHEEEEETEEEVEQQSNNKQPGLDEGTEAENGKVAEEDEDSEPSCNEEEDD